MSDLRRPNPPKQSRSSETMERILDACESLLRQRSFTEISTYDLCIEANASASSLYARFPTKGSILHALIDRRGDRIREHVENARCRLRAAGDLDLEDLTRALVEELTHFARQNDHLELAIAADETARARARRDSDAALEWLLDEVGAAMAVDDPAGRLRLEFALRAASAIVHRAIGSNVGFLGHMELTDEELVDEVTCLVTRYLRAETEACTPEASRGVS